MMFIHKITGVKICTWLREYHEVILAENDADAYTPFLRSHGKLIFTAILFKTSQINLKIMYIQKKRK